MKDFDDGDRCGISYYWQAAAVWVGGMRNITVRWWDGEMKNIMMRNSWSRGGFQLYF